jgi:raffinose/stachyose/melibiose transport system permease protein
MSTDTPTVERPSRVGLRRAAAVTGPSQQGRALRGRHRLALHAVLSCVALVWLIPVILMVSGSLVPGDRLNASRLGGLLVTSPSLDNYKLILSDNPVWRYLFNSLIIAVPTVALVVVFGSLTAFALAKVRFAGRSVVFWILLTTLALPTSAIVVALFQIVKQLGLLDSDLALILPYTALGIPFAVVIYRSAFQHIPHELAEAARVDGASRLRIYRSIYLPLVMPSTAVVVIWQFMVSWNEFLLPLVMLADKSKAPLTRVPQIYSGSTFSQPGALFAVLVMITLPVVVVYLLMQRYMVKGLGGAVK